MTSASPSSKKALVYDPDLGSGGGTEFVSTAIASALSQEYEVTLAGAGAEGLDARTLEERYSIALGEVPVIRLGPGDAEIHKLVRAADLFAVTHATWIPPPGPAKYSLLPLSSDNPMAKAVGNSAPVQCGILFRTSI